MNSFLCWVIFKDITGFVNNICWNVWYTVCIGKDNKFAKCVLSINRLVRDWNNSKIYEYPLIYSKRSTRIFIFKSFVKKYNVKIL